MIKSVYNFMDSCVYDGMPNTNSSMELPIESLILQKIKVLDFATPLIYGKDNKGTEVSHRRYEFKMVGSISDGWGFFYLYLVGEENFFKDNGYRYPTINLQAIPITYKILSDLTTEQKTLIYNDLN